MATDGQAMALGAAYGQVATRLTTDSVDWLRCGALAAVSLDAATTWYLLAVSEYQELNPILAAFWLIDPAVVAGYFGVFFVAVWLTTRFRHWLSTMISTTVVVVMGLFGGLNNLVLFVFGSPSLLEWLADGIGLSPTTIIITVAPACGLASALVVTRLRHRRLPWTAVVAVSGGCLGYLLYLSVAGLIVSGSTVAL